MSLKPATPVPGQLPPLLFPDLDHYTNLIQGSAQGIGRDRDRVYANIGDLHSQAKGSGARFNAGKTPYDLLPVSLLYALADTVVVREPDDEKDQAIVALMYLGLWQERAVDSGMMGEHPLMSALVAFPDTMASCAQVFAYGKIKYAAWNWTKGMAWSVPLGCAVRHLLAILQGEVNDPESGLPHVGHARCNLTMLWLYDVQNTHPSGDDRPPLGSLSDPSLRQGWDQEIWSHVGDL